MARPGHGGARSGTRSLSISLADPAAHTSPDEVLGMDKERINRSYLSRTIRLSLLAPDIVEAILNGTQPETLRLADLEAPFPIDWQEQRAAFGFLPKPACTT